VFFITKSQSTWSALFALPYIGILFIGTVTAQETSTPHLIREPLVISRLQGPIVLDGVINEPAWDAVQPLPLTVTQPVYRAEPSEKTEIRTGYDDQYIYVSGKCYTKDASTIRLNSLYRDRWSGDDTFGFMLDTFHDKENAVRFITTPGGIRIDQTISNDGEGGSASRDNSWNTFWDVATTVNDSGWFVEMRIPFSSLRFESHDGKVVMGMIVYRWIAFTNERLTFPDVPPSSSIDRPSQGHDIVFHNIQPITPVYVTPYALAGIAQKNLLSPQSNVYHLSKDPSREIGLDVKYPITSNMTLDATINTDFAQVEADDQQINLTRFPLFFPEKRQFFLERAGLFSVNLGTARSSIFHSRRIGLNDAGEPIRIIGGLRLMGRTAGWDIGALTMQTASDKGEASENFGVLRLRKQVLNAQSFLGGMVTSRVNSTGRYNYVYALDGVMKVIGDEYLSFTLAQSFDSKRSQPALSSPLVAGRIAFDWTRRVVEGFSYVVKFTWSHRDYDAGIGYDPRRDFSFNRTNIDYQWFLTDHPYLRKVGFGHWFIGYGRNADRKLESGWWHPFVRVEWQNAATVLLSTEHHYEDVLQPFLLSNRAAVPAGQYWFHNIWLQANPPDAWLFRPSINFFYGGFYDGGKTTVELYSTWNLSRYLELRPTYIVNFIRFDHRGERLNTHLALLRVQAALDTRASAAIVVQYNSSAYLVVANARLRYNFSEGHDLWLVYDEGLNTDRDRVLPQAPRLPLTNTRAVLLKYVHTLQI
jgi:hypothetical protein